ncbi:hypothetical protein ASC75_05060 [Aminobacter sp. DSM 101952]|nr:hypothetical protein ASC75_05060 [Aminobacter sp. DSM 101952]
MDNLQHGSGANGPGGGETASAYGFTHGEVTAKDTITAYIVVGLEPPQNQRRIDGHQTGWYVIVCAGQGRDRALWGAGSSDYDTPLLAFAGDRLLREFGPEVKLVVHAPKALESLVAPVSGHVRRAMVRRGRNSRGEPFPAFAESQRLALALDAGRWALCAYDRAASTPALEAARSLAKKVAAKRAREHRRQTDPSYNSPDYLAPMDLVPAPTRHAIDLEGEVAAYD